MSQTSWRALAGLLAIAAGTIVVVASDNRTRSNPAGSCCNGSTNYEPCCAMPCPPIPAQCPAPCEPQCPGCPIVEAPAPALPTAVVPVVAIEEIKAAPTATQTVALTSAVSDVPCKVRMETANGVTIIHLSRGENVALQIQCDRVDMQMPAGGLQAVGRVCVTAPGIEVRCNKLLIGWATGDILMEGQVRAVCQNGQHKTQMSADSISCRLNNVGTGLEFRQD